MTEDRHEWGHCCDCCGRVDELEEALRFYADSGNWRKIEQPLEEVVTDYDDEGNEVERVEKFWGLQSRLGEDGGNKARAALSGGEQKEGEA